VPANCRSRPRKGRNFNLSTPVGTTRGCRTRLCRPGARGERSGTVWHVVYSFGREAEVASWIYQIGTYTPPGEKGSHLAYAVERCSMVECSRELTVGRLVGGAFETLLKAPIDEQKKFRLLSVGIVVGSASALNDMPSVSDLRLDSVKLAYRWDGRRYVALSNFAGEGDAWLPREALATCPADTRNWNEEAMTFVPGEFHLRCQLQVPFPGRDVKVSSYIANLDGRRMSVLRIEDAQAGTVWEKQWALGVAERYPTWSPPDISVFTVAGDDRGHVAVFNEGCGASCSQSLTLVSPSKGRYEALWADGADIAKLFLFKGHVVSYSADQHPSPYENDYSLLRWDGGAWRVLENVEVQWPMRG